MVLVAHVLLFAYFHAALSHFPLVAEPLQSIAARVLNKSLSAGTNASPTPVPLEECPGDVADGCGEDFYDTTESDSTKSILGDSTQQRVFPFDRLSNDDLINFKRGNWDLADGQELSLRQVVLMHRHGDRTPIDFGTRDSLEDEQFWHFHGKGQLTNRGKARLYMLGIIIRQRYNKFLNGSVNKMWRKSRSSGALRCIESAQMFLSSFLSLDVPHSPDAKSLIWVPSHRKVGHLWQPASITSLPAKLDGMLNEGAECLALRRVYEELNVIDGARKLMITYREEAEVLNRTIGFEIDDLLKWGWANSLLEVQRSYFKEKMAPEIIKIHDRVREASDISLSIYHSNPELQRFRSGLAINDILNHMKSFRNSSQQTREDSNSSIKKFIHYTGHDQNLGLLLGMLGQLDKYPARPDYAAHIIMELHEPTSENNPPTSESEWFVRFFYMQHVPSKLIELRVADCERDHKLGRCTLDRLDQMMEKFKISSWLNWMSECKNDLHKVDLYHQNS